jgi:hypothetical protein
LKLDFGIHESRQRTNREGRMNKKPSQGRGDTQNPAS